MTSEVVKWQTAADRVMERFRRHIVRVARNATVEARRTVLGLFSLRRVTVDATYERGFQISRHTSEMRLGLSGLKLIFAAGQARGFGGLAPDQFREIAIALYIFHEYHHVTQGLGDFADVQALKYAAGENKLGELDTVADAVSAQIFAQIEAAENEGTRNYYAGAFKAALEFMISFCFPAFGFPENRRHKAQRALGIVLMTSATIRAINRKGCEENFDSPLYPYLSDAYDLIVVVTLGGQPTQSVQNVGSLSQGAIRDLLAIIDSGDIGKIIEHARIFV